MVEQRERTFSILSPKTPLKKEKIRGGEESIYDENLNMYIKREEGEKIMRLIQREKGKG